MRREILLVALVASQLIYYLLIAQTGVVEYFHSDITKIFWLPLGGVFGSIVAMRVRDMKIWLSFALILQLISILHYPQLSPMMMLIMGVGAGISAPIIIRLIDRDIFVIAVALGISYIVGTILFNSDVAGRGELAIILTIISFISLLFRGDRKSSRGGILLQYSTIALMALWVFLDSSLFETLSRSDNISIWRDGYTLEIALFHTLGVLLAIYKPLSFRDSNRVILSLFALSYIFYIADNPLLLSIVYPIVISYYNVVILKYLSSEIDFRKVAISMLIIGWIASGGGLFVALSSMTYLIAIALFIYISYSYMMMLQIYLRRRVMKKAFAFTILLATLLPASVLHLQRGYIKAHTTVIGDSSINPATSKIYTKLHISGDITTIRGSISIPSKSLKSDNSKRDEHMYETLGVSSHKYIKFYISKITKSSKGYMIVGKLTLHGKSRRVTAPATITVDKKGHYRLKSHFSIKMSDYGIKPPKLLFLSVRDRVDITVDLRLKK